MNLEARFSLKPEVVTKGFEGVGVIRGAHRSMFVPDAIRQVESTQLSVMNCAL